jgi:RNA polymerase sigma-70 factor (ECF subfamily)
MGAELDHFDRFVRDVEPKLRRALVAAFGPDEGRQAAADALTWAWEHWQQVSAMGNPAGYLYRVGRTAAGRSRPRDLPVADLVPEALAERADIEPKLLPALAALSEQQRSAVILVHGFGYSLREAALVLDLSPSTVHLDCKRGLSRLRSFLGGNTDVR